MNGKIITIGILGMFLFTCAVPSSIVGMQTKIDNENMQKHISTINNPIDEKWSKIYGGYNWESGCDIQITTDGGYIIVGHTESFGAGKDDVWLIKIDSNGNKLWSKTYGTELNEWGNSLQQTDDGGFIITGLTGNILAGDFGIWLLKTDAQGNIKWDKTFLKNDGIGNCVQQTTDGGYIITGYVDSNACLIKTDSDGNELWNKTFGISSVLDIGSSVRQTNDDGYIVVGSTRSYGSSNMDVWLIKIDSNGKELWNKTFGGNDADMGHSVEQTNDGGYIISGTTESFSAGYDDVWLIKTDIDGKELWNKTFGSAGYSDNIGDAGDGTVRQTSDGGYILTGRRDGGHYTGFNVWLIKTDENGIQMWDKTYDYKGFNDEGCSVQQTSDGGYIIVGTVGRGYSNDDIWIIKTDKDGNTKNKPRIFSQPSIQQSVTSLLFRILQRLSNIRQFSYHPGIKLALFLNI